MASCNSFEADEKPRAEPATSVTRTSAATAALLRLCNVARSGRCNPMLVGTSFVVFKRRRHNVAFAKRHGAGQGGVVVDIVRSIDRGNGSREFRMAEADIEREHENGGDRQRYHRAKPR